MITSAWVLPLPSLTVQGSVGTSLSKPGAALFPAQLVSRIAQSGNRCFNAATISISCNRESCSRPISTCSSRASRPNSASAFPSPLRIFSPSVGNDFQQTRGNERFGHFQISRISHPYGGRPPLDVASRVHAVGASKNTCSSVCVVVSWHPPTEARILLDAILWQC